MLFDNLHTAEMEGLNCTRSTRFVPLEKYIYQVFVSMWRLIKLFPSSHHQPEPEAVYLCAPLHHPHWPGETSGDGMVTSVLPFTPSLPYMQTLCCESGVRHQTSLVVSSYMCNCSTSFPMKINKVNNYI